LTGIAGIVQIAVQQDMRQGANDLQIQMAEDGALALSQGVNPEDLAKGDAIEISESLTPWIAVFDEKGILIKASSVLDAAPIRLPQGVFDTSGWETPLVGHHRSWMDPQTENRFSWQPREGVRQAVVLVRAENGDYVAAGRSLREVEKRESNLSFQVLLGWLISLIGSLFFGVAGAFLKKRF